MSSRRWVNVWWSISVLCVPGLHSRWPLGTDLITIPLLLSNVTSPLDIMACTNICSQKIAFNSLVPGTSTLPLKCDGFVDSSQLCGNCLVIAQRALFCFGATGCVSFSNHFKLPPWQVQLVQLKSYTFSLCIRSETRQLLGFHDCLMYYYESKLLWEWLPKFLCSTSVFFNIYFIA